MIYIVTGMPRTGTSMMTRCLAMSSSVPVVRDLTHEAKMAANAAVPDINGYWVFDESIERVYTGSLLKVPYHRIPTMSVGPLMVVRMNRSLSARKSSYDTQFGDGALEQPRYIEMCEQADEHLHRLTRSGECNLVDVDYEAVVADPVGEFTRIAGAGWPIDVKVAAALVDPTLMRF